MGFKEKLRQTFNDKNTYCLVCNEKIPFLQLICMTRYSGAECSHCHSYMTHKKYIFLLQDVLFILIFPCLAIMFNFKQYLLGSAGLILVLTSSFMLIYLSKFKIDPAHKHRLKNNIKTNNPKED